MSETRHEGGCLCGAVRYRTTDTPARVLACHCTTCKQRTGSAYGVGVYFPAQQVEFTGATPQTYEFHSDTSGRWIRNEFCAQCGTTVSWTLEMRPGMRAIAGGSYDDPHWYTIQMHIWTRSARADMCYPDHAELHEQALPPA